MLKGVTVVVLGVILAASPGRGEEPAPAQTPANPPIPPVSTSRETLLSHGWSLKLPLGLPAQAARIPEGNGMSDQKATLGKFLFFDPRLSKDSTVSCSSCHSPFHGFAEPTRTSRGAERKLGTRNAPTLVNRIFTTQQGWDGREPDLEHEIHAHLTSATEMGTASDDDIARRIRDIAGYAPLFKKAFGDDAINTTRIDQAIAVYVRTLVSAESPYDRYLAGQTGALSPLAVRGIAVFNGKGNCVACHAGFNLSDESYQNTGVGWNNQPADPGRFAVTNDEADRGKFKVPTLRNVSLTAPYMHDGSEDTLAAVVEFYNRGAIPNPKRSKEFKQLRLTDDEKRSLLAFLESLTGITNNTSPPVTLPK